MKTILSLITVLSFALPSAIAQDDAEAKIKEIIDAHQVKVDAFTKEIQAAPREDQAKIYREKYPKPDGAAEQLMEIIKANPKDPAVVDAANWIAQNVRGGDNAAIADVIVKHHLDDEKILNFVSTMGYNQSEESRQFLKTVMEKSKIKDVRGMALYSYAAQIERDEKKVDEYTTLIEQFVKEHSDLEMRGRNLADRAKGKLFAAKNLRIGSEAPEIVGKDVDGNEMKLSDYRGKVVVIDFWGDW